MRTRERFGAVVLGSGIGVLALAAPAVAVLNPPNTIGCAGSATITSGDATHSVDVKNPTVTVPRSGTISYTGSTSVAVHHFTGSITLDLGLATPSYSFDGNNNDSLKTKQGTAELPGALAYIPPGTYHATANLAGDEGSCSASVDVVIEGNLLSSPAGIFSLVGTVAMVGVLAKLGLAAKGA